MCRYPIYNLEIVAVNNPVHTVNTEDHEAAVLQAVATRAFLRPSKFLMERHMMPTIPWRSVRYCWSALAKTSPVRDFWTPVPGIVAHWPEKLRLLVEAYSKANLIQKYELISSKMDEVNHLYIKIGLDGTNLWKAKLETLTMSFAQTEHELHKRHEAVHLLALYVGKEDYSTLATINSVI